MTRYGNGRKEDVTRCSYPIGFAHKARQCLRKRSWWVDGREIGNMERAIAFSTNKRPKKLFCKQHAKQLANQYEGEW